MFSRTFLVHVWRKCRSAECFCRQMIYSMPRVDLFCALCTSWSVAKYCRLCWQLILFDMRSAALHYCTQAISGTVCLVYRYLLRIKYSAFCTRCSWVLKLCQGKNNWVLLATRIISFWMEWGHVFVSRSFTESWRNLPNWCNCWGALSPPAITFAPFDGTELQSDGQFHSLCRTPGTRQIWR